MGVNISLPQKNVKKFLMTNYPLRSSSVIKKDKWNQLIAVQIYTFMLNIMELEFENDKQKWYFIATVKFLCIKNKLNIRIW